MSDAGFNGLTVAAFENRMAAEMTGLIERYGGRPMVTPARLASRPVRPRRMLEE